MRNTFLLLSLSLAACAPHEPVPGSLLYRSTFQGTTRGLVLHESGGGGHAGMFQTNCPFETVTGTVTGDYDLPGEDEDIQDGESTTMGDVTLTATLPDTVYVLDKTDGVYTTADVPIEDVEEARLTWDGVVGLTPACHLTWKGFDGAVRAETTVGSCSGDLETDPATGDTVVADPDDTVITDGVTTSPSDVDGDLVAYDDQVDAFYVATRGEARLSAIERDGRERWTVETPGIVTALDDGGRTGTANVVLELANGKGALAVYDGYTGEQRYFSETPSPADDLSVSGNGAVVALVRAEQVFFYGVPAEVTDGR